MISNLRRRTFFEPTWLQSSIMYHSKGQEFPLHNLIWSFLYTLAPAGAPYSNSEVFSVKWARFSLAIHDTAYWQGWQVRACAEERHDVRDFAGEDRYYFCCANSHMNIELLKLYLRRINRETLICTLIHKLLLESSCLRWFSRQNIT